METFDIAGKKYKTGKVIRKTVTAKDPETAAALFNAIYNASAYMIKKA